MTMTSDASPQQVRANRINGKLGGVKTDEGKAAVRFNARTHGILGELHTEYEDNVHTEYLEKIHDHYQPVGFMECLIVRRIADACLMLYRANKAEREFMLARLSPSIIERVSDLEYDRDSYKPVMRTEAVERLSNIYLRYQTTIENRLYRATHELERLQRMRKGEDVQAPMVLDVENENGFVSQNAP